MLKGNAGSSVTRMQPEAIPEGEVIIVKLETASPRSVGNLLTRHRRHGGAPDTGRVSTLRRRLVATFAGVLALGLVAAGGSAAWAIPTPISGPVAGGTTVTVEIPLAGFTQIDAGCYFALALDTNGDIWGWGRNDSGQLGVGSYDNMSVPTRLTTSGGFQQVSAGCTTSLALDTAGNIWAWGDNFYGQLGLGDTVERTVPTAVTSTVAFTSIYAADTSSYAIDENGDIWSWGSNNKGQLGVNDTIDKLTPTQATTSGGFAEVAGGYNAGLALDTAGDLWSWGTDAADGFTGFGDGLVRLVPTQLTATGGYVGIATGPGNSNFAIDSSGDLYAWGGNVLGQLGFGDTAIRNVPTVVPGMSNVTQVAVGPSHTLALDGTGNIWSWGIGGDGQLGQGSTILSSSSPAQATVSGGYTYIAAATSVSHGLRGDDSLWGAGYGGFGQLATGDTVRRYDFTMANLVVTTVTGVTFDGIPGTSLVDNGDGTVSIVTPPHAAGPVDVVLTWTWAGVAQTSVTYVLGFTYLDSPPVITTLSLPDGKVGTTYTQVVNVIGTGVTFAVTSGTLPPGLTLNPTTGVVSGTPTTTGTYTFSVSATNGAGSDERSYTVSVTAASPAAASSSDGSLAFTGSTPGPTLFVGIAMMATGLAAVAATIIWRRIRRPN